MTQVKSMKGVLSDREALNELLVAALTLSMQTHAMETADHVLDALRTLPAEAEDANEVGDDAVHVE